MSRTSSKRVEISEEESGIKYNRELPEHLALPWPEMDPLKLRAVQDGEEIVLMTYRYPV
jgi:hypothetical protein